MCNNAVTESDARGSKDLANSLLRRGEDRDGEVAPIRCYSRWCGWGWFDGCSPSRLGRGSDCGHQQTLPYSLPHWHRSRWIGAALGNMEEDHWEWHAFDTIKGSDYLADQDAVEIMCREAIDCVYLLEHLGLPFDRTPDGKIMQRRFGGHTNNITGEPVRRACHAADRTGHMILQTLYQQCIRYGVHFFNEFFVTDLLLTGDPSDPQTRCVGVVALEIQTGVLHIFHAKAVLLATAALGEFSKSPATLTLSLAMAVQLPSGEVFP